MKIIVRNERAVTVVTAGMRIAKRSSVEIEVPAGDAGAKLYRDLAGRAGLVIEGPAGTAGADATASAEPAQEPTAGSSGPPRRRARRSPRPKES